MSACTICGRPERGYRDAGMRPLSGPASDCLRAAEQAESSDICEELECYRLGHGRLLDLLRRVAAELSAGDLPSDLGNEMEEAAR